MWLSSSLTFIPHIFLLRLQSHQNFGRKEEGAFNKSPEYWNRGVLTIDLSCLYIKKFIFRDNWTEYFRIIKWNSLIHERTYIYTQFRLFCRLWGTLFFFSCLNLIPTRLLLCYVLLVHKLVFSKYCILVFSGCFPFWFPISDLLYLTQ